MSERSQQYMDMLQMGTVDVSYVVSAIKTTHNYFEVRLSPFPVESVPIVPPASPPSLVFCDAACPCGLRVGTVACPTCCNDKT